MKMKRICALVLSLALTTAAVSGCGSSKKKDAESSKPDSAAAVSSVAAESEAPAVSAAAEADTAVSEAASAVESIAEEAVEQAAEAVESVVEEAAASTAEDIAESAAEIAESALEAVESAAEEIVESAAEEIVESAAEEAEAVESAAEEIEESVAEDISESVAEDIVESVAEDISESVGEDIAESVAEDVSESVAEDIIAPVVERDVSAGAEEENPDRGLINGEPAFTAVWHQVSDVLAEGYTKLYELPKAIKAAPRESAYRISVDPDALNLLGLASETVLKTDLSWIEEIGIDVVSVVEDYKYDIYSGDPYLSGRSYESEYLGSGNSVVLHVNGQEIVTADMLLDEANQLFRLRLPELVSGEYSNMEIMREYTSSFREAAANYGIFLPTYTPMSTIWQILTGYDRLLPEPEIFREILATEDAVFDSFLITDDNAAALTAGSVSEECREVTGVIQIRELIKGAELLLDRIESDEDFRAEVIEFLDAYHDSFDRGTFSALAQALMRSPVGDSELARRIYRLDPYYFNEDLSVMVAFLTGKWEFREGALDEAAAKAAEAEAEADSDDDSEEEEVYDLRQLTVRPGMALTRTAYEALPSDQVSLMKKAIRKGDVLLKQEYSFGEKLYVVYGYYSGDIRGELKNTADNIPGNAYLELTGSFDPEGTLEGLRAAGLLMSGSVDAETTESAAEEIPAESGLREDLRMPIFAAAWPKEGENRACRLTIEEFPGSKGAAVLLEVLKDGESGKQELKVSVNADHVDVFNADVTVDPENGTQSCEAKACDSWGDELFAVDGLHTTDEESGAEKYTFTVATPGYDDPVFAVDAAMTPEDTKDVWTGSVCAEGEERGTLDGYYDWANGETSFTLEVPAYADVIMKGNLRGTIDLESGDGDLHISLKDEENHGWGSYSNTQIDLDLTAEGLKMNSDGSLAGKMSVTGDMSGAYTENVIPKGLTLFMDFDGQTAQIGDASGTYLTYMVLEESEYMPYERAHARILEMCEKENVRLQYARGDNNGLGNNWNILLPINRLLKAGMPQDFLKELSTNEEVQSIIDDIMYELS